MATETIKYSDLDLDFLPNPITKDVPLKYDVEAVKRSIRSLVFTNKYERLFQPDIDAGIHKLLFENLAFPPSTSKNSVGVKVPMPTPE